MRKWREGQRTAYSTSGTFYSPTKHTQWHPSNKDEVKEGGGKGKQKKHGKNHNCWVLQAKSSWILLSNWLSSR
jgi:hypothetical protein